MLKVRRALLLAGKDLRVFLRDRGAVLFAFGFPLIFVFAFSLFLPDAEQDTLAEVFIATEEGPESVSQALIAAVRDSPNGRFVELDPAQAEGLLADGVIDGYILFPAGFSTQALMPGGQATIAVVIDSDDPDTRAMLEGVAGGFADSLAQQQAAIAAAVSVATQLGAPPDPAALQAAVVELFTSGASGNPPVSVETEQAGDVEPVASVNYVLSGYVTMFLFFAAGFGAAELLRERTNNTLDRLLASGVSPGTLLAGKWLGTASRGLMQAIILWGFGVLFFNVDLGRAPLGVMLVTLAMLVASASFALFLASVAKTERAAESITVLASLTLAALGGSWWPLFITPEWMQTLAKITPHAWANEAFNKLLIFGATTRDILVNLLVLLLFAAVFIALALYRLRLRE